MCRGNNWSDSKTVFTNARYTIHEHHSYIVNQGIQSLNVGSYIEYFVSANENLIPSVLYKKYYNIAGYRK